MKHLTPILAHGDAILLFYVKLFIPMLVIGGVTSLLGLGIFVRSFFRDAIRLGRERIPWLWMLAIAAFFSESAYWLAGSWGLLAGLPLVIPFGIGRCLAKRREVNEHNESA